MTDFLVCLSVGLLSYSKILHVSSLQTWSSIIMLFFGSSTFELDPFSETFENF